MKRILLYAAFVLFVAPAVMAQAPQQLNYQAIVRDASGTPLPANTHVGLRFDIHQGSATGTVVYTETTTAVTNQFGLISYQIGSAGNLASVSWSSGSEFLQVQVDPTGGANYTDMGVSQLLSVPYALFSGNAASGPVGPTGSQGPQGNNGVTGSTGPTGVGIQGPAGPQGIAGVAGATGPQGLQGAAGANGASGANGANGPTGPQGVAGATGAQGNVGPQGPTGQQGAQGLQGPSGPQGIQGSIGATGPQGATGNAGGAGAQGPQGLQGPTGAPGLQGSVGATGPQGAIGNTGATGNPGVQGLQGPTGVQGSQGVAGVTGTQGIAGNDGPTGAQGLQGVQGPTGSQGVQGTQGVTGATGAQGVIGNNGATGAQGPQGDQGATGAQGPQGVVGGTGAQGIQGPQGPTGAQGAQGVAGNTGAQGIQGPTGNDGPTGAQGSQGPQGNQGNTGAAGANGATGSAGPTGLQGPQGNVGATGATGGVGPTGPQGAQGLQGPSGFQGVQGLPGNDGATGPTGNNGAPGSNGAAGATGPAGANGAPGPTGPAGTLASGTAAGNTTYWNGSIWVTNSSNIYNDGSLIGIGTTSPTQELDVAGNIAMNGRQAFNDYGDGWLRLNQNSDYFNGTYTPGFFRVDGGIASGGLGSLGAGTVTATGVINSNVGFTVSNGAASGNYLRGNGSDFVSATIQASDLANAISGNTNYVAKFTGPNSLGNSKITDDGNTIVFSPPTYSYFASGTVYAQSQIIARGGISNDAASTLLLSGGTSGATQWAGSILSPDQNGSIELGGNNSVSGTSTPYIDFHTSQNSSTDFDIRFMAISGSRFDLYQNGQATVVGSNLGASFDVVSPHSAGFDLSLWTIYATRYGGYYDIMNDLDSIDNIKPMKWLNPKTKQMETVMDVSTLPRDTKVKAGDGNYLMDMVNASALNTGAIRQLRAEEKSNVKMLEAKIDRLENLVSEMTGKQLGDIKFAATATAYKNIESFIIMDARISPKSIITIDGLSGYTIVDQGEGSFGVKFSSAPAANTKFTYSAKF